MIEIADVFRRFADDYLNLHGATMLPSHRRAIADVLRCRTAALGGHVYRCGVCDAEIFSYHSCKNRSCPKCHTEQTRRWLEARRAELLPVDHFHVTVTVPEELRALFRANQRPCYGLLMKAAAEAIIELARDPRYVGGTVGVLAVLHSWTQQLMYHPHVHCLVTGGGISADGQVWWPARQGFLVPEKALAVLVRGKLMAALAKRWPDLILPKSVWAKQWVVHCTPWGKGEPAVLDYLARRRHRQLPLQEAQGPALADLPASGRGVHAPLPPARPAQERPQDPLLRPVAPVQAGGRAAGPTALGARPPQPAIDGNNRA
jgi:hypothetical protein